METRLPARIQVKDQHTGLCQKRVADETPRCLDVCPFGVLQFFPISACQVTLNAF